MGAGVVNVGAIDKTQGGVTWGQAVTFLVTPYMWYADRESCPNKMSDKGER